VKRIGWRYGLGRLPSRLNPGWPALLSAASAIAPPWPDVWIAAGRASLPISARTRRLSGGRTFVVQTQDPKRDPAAFDLVVSPAHDEVTGANVVPIVGAPNRLSEARLAADLARFEATVSPQPHPRVAVIIGGKSSAFDLPPARAAAIGHEVAEAVRAAGGSIMASFTRRTPTQARTILQAAWRDLPGVVWDDRGDNPYFAFLAMADAILVTEDSTNLATDAAFTGKPVHILGMMGGSEKFRRFHADLRQRRVARPFDGTLPAWSYAPLRETDRAAIELLRRYDARK
jgi:mitochondrial fission protein ELM1